MIDLHSHYLFDVDDGARTIEDSLSMLRTAADDGVTRMVATPHQRHPAGYHVEPELARRRLADVEAAAAREGIGIEFGLAAEIHFSENIPEGIKEGTLLPYSGDGRYFLFELPVTTIPGNINEVIFSIQMAGHFPVLAHPERNFEVMDNPKIIRDLRDRGVLMQLTAQSLLGKFGRKTEKVCRRLLKWGVVDIIASDAHNPERRPPGLSQAVRLAAKIVGFDRAELMVTDTPERILLGKAVN